MKKLLLLVLAAPLAGCTQRADLASSVGQPAPGPFTLRYKLADQNSNQYQLRIEGDTTSGLSSPSTSEPAAGGTTKAPERTVQAKFNTQMTIQQDASAALDSVSDQAASTSSDTAATGSSGQTSMNEDRAPGSERAGDTMMPESAASEGSTTSEGSTAAGSAGTTDTSRFELRQQVKNWTAQVDLPEGQIPNRLSGNFQDGQMNVQAQGAQIDLPQRYQQQIQQTLSRPVIATVTSKGEILNVEWPVPEQAAATTPGVKTEPAPDGLRAMTGSTETLNLWFGVIRLPDEAVNVGQIWDAKDQFPVRAGTNGPQFHMEREAKYTLTNVTQTPDGPVAEIAVNETLKLVRGELTSSDSTAATTGSDASVTDDSTSAGAAISAMDSTAKPDLLETRMGKVYFNIDRGIIDRSEQQVSVTWDTTVSEAAGSTGTSSTQVATQGQLQGTIHLDRITTAATAPNADATGPAATTPPSPSTDSSPAETSPSTAAPSTAAPGTSSPSAGTRTPAP